MGTAADTWRQDDLFHAAGLAPVVDVAPGAAGTAALAASLPPSLFLGTSSWAFPGWTGLVYDGQPTAPLLAREGLAAYARHPLLRAVGIDRSWYAPLDVGAFARYAAQVPEHFRFLVKAHRLLTDPLLDAGRANPRFLDPQYAVHAVAAPFLDGLGEHAGPLLFQFTPGAAHRAGGAGPFCDGLHAMLSALPAGATYAVEVRDDALLTPRYFRTLAATGARHCLSLHPAVDLDAQIRGLSALPPGPLVARWNLHPALRYEQARDAFAPFDRLRRPDAVRRARLAGLCAAALDAGESCFVIANNKAEGSAPLTLEALGAAIAAIGAAATGQGTAATPRDDPTVTPGHRQP